jgi:hypothetical protein
MESIAYTVGALVIAIAIWLQLLRWTEAREMVHTQRATLFARRSRIVIGFGLGAFVFPTLLGTFHVAEYHSTPVFGPFPDQSLAERICFTSQAMAFGCISAYVLACIRISKEQWMDETHGRFTQAVGFVGLVVLLWWCADFFLRPYSQTSLYLYPSWRPLIGWFLVCWYYMFREQPQRPE